MSARPFLELHLAIQSHLSNVQPLEAPTNSTRQASEKEFAREISDNEEPPPPSVEPMPLQLISDHLLVLTHATLSTADIGKTVKISGGQMKVDDVDRAVQWEMCNGTIGQAFQGKVKSVEVRLDGLVQLEDGQEFGNPANGVAPLPSEKTDAAAALAHLAVNAQYPPSNDI